MGEEVAAIETGRKTPQTVKNNILTKVELEAAIDHVLHNVADIVSKTLGPFGANSLIVEPYQTVPVNPSKDGYRVIQSIRYDDVTFNAIFGILRDLAARMNMDVGDSTTSGFRILANLYSALKSRRKDYESKDGKAGYSFHKLVLDGGQYSVTPYGIKNVLDAVEHVLTEIIQKNYVVKPDTHERRVELIRRVATISGNNDPAIGNLIADIVAEYSEGTADEIFIDVEKSDGEKTEVHKQRGFQFGAGFTHYSMINDVEGIGVDYENPNFLLVNGPLTDNDLETVTKVVNAISIQKGEPLIIIASEFTNGVNNFFFQYRTGVRIKNNKGEEKIIKVPIVGICMEMLSPEAQERLRDLEVAIGGKALATQQGKILDFTEADAFMYLGHAERIKSQPNLTSIFNGRGDAKEIEVRVNELREARLKYAVSDNPNEQFQLHKIDRRIGMLRSNMAAIKVGGRTYKEKEFVYDLYVDAVAASMSVLRHGATLGGNLSVVAAIRNNTDAVVETIHTYLKDSRKVVVFGNDEVETKKAITTVLSVVEFAFKTAYYQVVLNAVQDEEDAFRIFDSVDKQLDNGPCVVNLLTGKTEYFIKNESLAGVDANLLVAGNTDIALLQAIFTVVSTFLMANQLVDVQYA